MILVDVFVPALNRNYDFRLNENMAVGEVIDEITELICQKEHCKLDGKKEKFLLCNFKTGEILDTAETFAQEGIVSGMRLFLV